MKIGKNIELLFKKLFYFLFKLIFRNREVQLPVSASSNKKVLILRYDRLGDMVISIPAFNFLKSINPDIQIDVIATPKNSCFIENDPAVRKIYKYDGKKWNLFRLIAEARKEKYDPVFCWVFTRSTFGGLLSNLIAGKRALKITQRNEQRYKLYSAFFNVQIPCERNKELMAEMLVKQISSVFQVPYKMVELSKKINLSEDAFSKANIFCREKNLKDFIFFNISSSNKIRRFSAGKNIEILNEILQKWSNEKIILHYSPEDSKEAKKIFNELQDKITLFPLTSDMLLVSAVVSMAKVVITPDTSIVHIASAYDKKLLALYSTVDNSNNEWLPMNANAIVLTAPEGQPLGEIGTERIILAFNELINESNF